jgi:dipeptidyl aminopeptidase/acylaminoacyl peptidase
MSTRTAAPPRFEQFFALRRTYYLNNLAFSPDSRHISYVHDGSGLFNLWSSPVEGGVARQLTSGDEDAVRHHRWASSGIVLELDHLGAEQWQLNVMPPDGLGWPRAVTDRQDVQYEVGPVADDGRRMLIDGNQERSTDVSIYLLDIPSGLYKLILDKEGRQFYAGPWHPDGRRAAVSDVHGNTDQNAHLLDVESGELRNLTPHDDEELNAPVGFSADGSRLYNLTDRDAEHNYLEAIDIATGARTPLVKAEWGVEQVDLSGDRRRIAYTINEHGYSRFHARDIESGRELPFPDMPQGDCSQFAISPDGRLVAGLVATGTRVFDVYVADLETGRATRVTDNFLGGIPEAELVEPELVHFPSFDGKQIPAWLYRPHDASGMVPLVLSIHGGPEAQERTHVTRSSSFYQYLLSRGIAVLAPNIRGSTGYGKSYQKLIHRDFGGDELKDIDHAARWLRAQSWVDSTRIAVYGASFGGFATLSAMTRLPDYWRCGIDLVGPSNLVTFAKAVPPHWRAWMKGWVGDPEEDFDFLMSRSPITYVENMKAPLLVLQGANDPRCVKPESDQMVEKLRSIGVDVEYHVFEDEGHDFSKRANQLKAYRLIAAFLFKQFGIAPEGGNIPP